MVMARLAVYLHDEFVGYLWLDEKRRFVFQYDKNYMNYPDAMPISLYLPLREEPYIDDIAKPFFSNLLPEGEIRARISKIKHISKQNDFKLLEAIGGECAGAVSILPQVAALGGEEGYLLLPDQEVEQLMEENAVKPILIIKDELRLSLAGAQNKIPVYINNNKFYLPVGIAPSSHILKPQNLYFENMVQNEYFCMLLAKAVGLPVPKSFIWKGKKHIAYIVERYDRVKKKDGSFTRIHQEDLCQVLGCMPDQKYETEGGPCLADCFRLIETHSINPVSDKQSLIKWVVFNCFIGNADAHGKNLSFIRTGGGSIRLAPFYDLISTRVYPELSSKMAMKIGMENRFDWVVERHWLRLADQLDLKFAYLKQVIGEIAYTFEKVSTKIADKLIDEFDGNKTVLKICNILSDYIKHVRHFL